MAPKKDRAREAQLAFEALSIEGGLLSPEWLSRVAQMQASGQSEADYKIPKGLNLRDEIGRYWRIAQAHWSEFDAGRLADKEGTNGLALAERFVLGLLRDSFGFTSLAPSAPVELAGHVWPIRYAALGGQVPVIIAAPARAGDGESDTHAPKRSGLDIPDAAFGDDGRRRTASGLAQEFLNAEERALWGLASDGVTLRILRDNVSLRAPWHCRRLRLKRVKQLIRQSAGQLPSAAQEPMKHLEIRHDVRGSSATGQFDGQRRSARSEHARDVPARECHQGPTIDIGREPHAEWSVGACEPEPLAGGRQLLIEAVVERRFFQPRGRTYRGCSAHRQQSRVRVLGWDVRSVGAGVRRADVLRVVAPDWLDPFLRREGIIAFPACPTAPLPGDHRRPQSGLAPVRSS